MCFLYITCIYDTFWWVGIVAVVNVHEGYLKIEFLHPLGSRKASSWPSVADKCFVPASNILCVITAPTTITRQIYWISDTDFQQIHKKTIKPYENHKTAVYIYKAVVRIWSFLSLGTNGLFFLNFWLCIRSYLVWNWS